MDEQVRQALRNVTDSYDDFINCYTKDLKGDTEKQKKLLDYLRQNPDAKTDDVMDYVEDVLLAS